MNEYGMINSSKDATIASKTDKPGYRKIKLGFTTHIL